MDIEYLSLGNTVTDLTAQGVNATDNFSAGLMLYTTEYNTVKKVTSNGFTGGEGIRLTTSANHNTLTDLTVTGNNYGIGIQYDSQYNTLSGVNASGNATGIAIESSAHHNTLSDITAAANDGALALSSSSHDNTITDAVLKNNTASGIYANGTSNNTFRRISCSNNGLSGWGPGLILYSSSNNQVFDFRVDRGAGHGIQLYGGSAGNTISRVNISNVVNVGILIEEAGTNGNVITEATIQNGGDFGISLSGGAARNSISQVTLVNHDEGGIVFEGSDKNTVNQIVSANAVDGVAFIAPASNNNTLSQLVSTHNTNGITLGSNKSKNSKFSGNLLVGSNSTKNCQRAGTDTNAGLKDTDCTTTGTEGSSTYTAGYLSDAVLRVGRSVASSFVGKVTSDDPSNTSDTDGAASFPADPLTFDWLTFANPFRSWGRDGSAFPNSDHTANWQTGEGGRIWDWRLVTTDPYLLNKSGDGATNNQSFVGGGTCPSSVDGNKTTFDQQTTVHTYLLNAVEIVDPLATGYSATGNHNGLCETTSTAVYTPNLAPIEGTAPSIPAASLMAPLPA